MVSGLANWWLCSSCGKFAGPLGGFHGPLLVSLNSDQQIVFMR